MNNSIAQLGFLLGSILVARGFAFLVVAACSCVLVLRPGKLDRDRARFLVSLAGAMHGK